MVTAVTGEGTEQLWTLTPEACIGQELSKDWNFHLFLTLPSAEGNLDQAVVNGGVKRGVWVFTEIIGGIPQGSIEISYL